MKWLGKCASVWKSHFNLISGNSWLRFEAKFKASYDDATRKTVNSEA